MRKYYVIYDHKMDAEHIPRNFYYRLDGILDGSGAEKIQYSVVACGKRETARKVTELCGEYHAKVKVIEGEFVDLDEGNLGDF